jgi:putative molybdopterin biosynthesis protein
VPLHDTLRAARLGKGLTQKQVAAKLGVKQPTVWGWESGKSVPVRDRWRDVARVYGVPVGAFFPAPPKRARS